MCNTSYHAPITLRSITTGSVQHSFLFITRSYAYSHLPGSTAEQNKQDDVQSIPIFAFPQHEQHHIHNNAFGCHVQYHIPLR